MSETRPERQETKRARLSLDDFRVIHAWNAEHGPAWATRAFELAIVTALRPGDLRALRFAQAREGFLWVTPEKTAKHGTKLAFSLDLRLDALGLSVGGVIVACRDAVVSPLCLHHCRPIGRARVGSAIGEKSLELEFRRARDACGISTPKGRTPASLYEIRSLSARLYAAQGVDAQALLGHRSATTTAVYKDVRGSEWIRVG